MRRPLAMLVMLPALGVPAGACAADTAPIVLYLQAPPTRMLGAPPPPMLMKAPAPMSPPPASARATTFHVPDSFLWVGGTALPQRTQYDGLIREITAHHGVEYALVKAMIKAESDFDRLAVSPVGARGLMQLMPATAAERGVRQVFLPRANIDGGCRHLRDLLDRYDGNVVLAVAAYNAGVKRVDDAGGVPAIAETREYLARVLRYRHVYQREGTGKTL